MMIPPHIKEKLEQLYQSRLGDPARLGQYLLRLMTDSRVPLSAKLQLAGTGLYGVLERDLISDNIKWIPGFGLADDIILIVHGIRVLMDETDEETAVSLWPGDVDSFERTMKLVVWLDDTLYGNVRNAVISLFQRPTTVAKIIRLPSVFQRRKG